MLRLFALTTLSLSVSTPLPAAEPFADPEWRYLLKFPGKDWFQPGFDDSGWNRGHGGFGESSTPGSRVGTNWTTRAIWLRRTVHLDPIPTKPALYLYHDEDAKVFINGELAAQFEGFITEYKVHPIPTALLKPGANHIAVHCKQTTGGQAIDVHIIDAQNIPTLPKPKRPDKPFQSELITEWGAKVTPENAWREYPRPQLIREQWTNLNGHWDYAITTKDAPRPSTWDGRILVPFAVESKLSGVQRLLHDDKALWYRRPLEAKAQDGKRLLINFEAVDYHCDVWVNNTKVGAHTGGNTPFQFDITAALNADGENHLVVRVEDSTGGYQLRGKQTTDPRGIWYTQVSGIWGTVWTEEVPEIHIADLKIQTKNDGSITLLCFLNKDAPEDFTLSAGVTFDGTGASETTIEGGGRIIPITLEVESPELWSPDSPELYAIKLQAGDDKAESYLGFREVGRTTDADGHIRFTLNGEAIFHWGPLDQGWWPDGLLTPPSDEGMRWDVDYLKAAGFNMIRKHIKVEPRRFYAYCDEIGMMVWQDQVSAGNNPPWTRLKPDPKDADWPDAAHEQYMLELDRMITALENHPCIVQWVPFNEAWGQHRTMMSGIGRPTATPPATSISPAAATSGRSATLSTTAATHIPRGRTSSTVAASTASSR